MPGIELELRSRRKPKPAFARRVDQSAGDRMLGKRLDAGDKAQRLIGVEFRRRDEIGQARLAESERARLVEGDETRFAQGLQRLAFAKQHAKLGGAARAGHDRGRRREAHRAGARDDQHGDRVDESEGEARLRAHEHPDDESRGGDGEDDRHEDGGDAIDARLNWKLRALRLLHHADHARKESVGADAVGLESEGSGAIHSCPGHGRAGRFRHGRGLAGDHRFVDMRRPAHNDAVGWNPIARTHEHHVADAHLLRRNVERLAATLDVSDARRQRGERGDGSGRPTFGARLQQSAQKDERDDHAGGFVIDLSRAGGQQLRGEGRNGGKEIGAGRADRDERVHIRRAAEKRRESLFEEDASGEGEQQARQDEGEILRRLVSEMRQDPFVKGWDQMAAHLDDHDRRRQRGGDDEPARQGLGLLLARVPLGRERAFGLARLVAGFGDGALQRLEAAGPLERAHARALGR